jgi:hypothetical protein
MTDIRWVTNICCSMQYAAIWAIYKIHYANQYTAYHERARTPIAKRAALNTCSRRSRISVDIGCGDLEKEARASDPCS